LPVYPTNFTSSSYAIVSWFPIGLNFAVANRAFYLGMVINVFMHNSVLIKKLEFHAETSAEIFVSI